MMEIKDLDHVEFYVGNAPLTAFYLCKAYGFAVCAEGGPETGVADHRSLLLRQRDIQLVVTSGLTPSHPATTYVSRHGDGIANLGFGTTDAATAFAEAVAGGAKAINAPVIDRAAETPIVTAMVGGFGDVGHRFVERHSSADISLLPGLTPLPIEEQEQPLSLLSGIDHVAVCLPAGELASTADFYRSVFGFKNIFSERLEVGEQAMNSQVVQSPSGGVTLTLIECGGGRSRGQIDAFLARHGGAGVQHLAMLTEDIITTVRELKARGVEFLYTPDTYYEDLACEMEAAGSWIKELQETRVLMDRDPWGELFQIFTASVHQRDTFFTEIIARDGARTFGSRNIRALYDAVERAGMAAS